MTPPRRRGLRYKGVPGWLADATGALLALMILAALLGWLWALLQSILR